MDGLDGDADPDAEVCFICANPVIHHSIAPCNHVTCHICALRMRALYKNKGCAHCRTPAPFVIFTDDASKRFEEYTDANITSTDDNIGIRYTSEEIVGDTVLLLRYNCPDPSCDFAGLGWPDLHRHVRSVHHKKMCDLCTRNKKVFTHEHELFTDKGLEKHMRHGDDKPGSVEQTGFKGHPLCGFCGERFYDDDKLYEHCRNKHERCFICDRRDSRQPHYYLDYNALEEHFKKDHFICLDRECLEKKFVVFESELDLKAHQLSEHADSLSKDVRRDARVVDISGFDFRQSYQQERRGGGRGGGGSGAREGRGRGRDPNAEPLPRTAAQPLRRDELAFQRQMAIHSAQSVSNRTFGGQLTTTSNSSGPTPAAAQNGTAARSSQAQPLADAMGSLSVADTANLNPQERARLVRHGAVIERASNLLSNDAAKMATFRAHISSYRNGTLSAPQLIDGFFALFSDTSSNALGTLVREVADLFEDKAKADALRKAWHDWRAINEDYPSLPGLGGMHGATTSTSGWANAAAASPTTHGASAAAQQKHSTRVLKLKNSTRRGSGAGLGPSPSTPVTSVTWTAPSAGTAVRASSSAFPALPGAGGSGSRSAQPSWIGGTASSINSTPRSGTTTPARRTGPARGSASEDAFPALPAAPRPTTTIFGYGTGAVRRDFGASRDTGFSWGGSSSGANSAQQSGEEGEPGAGKERKKGKKQVLIQWG
ncbi:E3 ubiquitin-protein ligase hel2 [Pleurostoma richardsiae]|uniref:RING-type E3 ubiquitin transferase n=1 Tax=Pleurostoma richardsiae TaxID=41990 RepID=A0AA38S793_9PEZI|nr:E3 ubiquitin-protein ligase hel2 [Pleurostoma richardsiae]